MNNIRRRLLKIRFRVLYFFNAEKYKKTYPQFLRQLGIDVPQDYYEGGHGFIHPSVMFDGSDFSMISIGKNTTISVDVVFLTHDFSIGKGLQLIGAQTSGKFLKPIRVGSNCFIGMRSILLPGTTVGDNVIVGAGAVLKGNYPSDVVVAGNPARVISTTKEWAQRHYEKQDYIELNR